MPKDPQGFLATTSSAANRPYAIAAQRMIAEFLSSNETRTIDPDGEQTIFEMPLVGPLPDGWNYIP